MPLSSRLPTLHALHFAFRLLEYPPAPRRRSPPNASNQHRARTPCTLRAPTSRHQDRLSKGPCISPRARAAAVSKSWPAAPTLAYSTSASPCATRNPGSPTSCSAQGDLGGIGAVEEMYEAGEVTAGEGLACGAEVGRLEGTQVGGALYSGSGPLRERRSLLPHAPKLLHRARLAPPPTLSTSTRLPSPPHALTPLGRTRRGPRCRPSWR